MKSGEVIVREMVVNDEGIDGRRGRERGDVIVVNVWDNVMWGKVVVVEKEEGGWGKGLWVEVGG